MLLLLQTYLESLLLEREEGATAVEYGIMVALIAAVIVAIVALLGQNILQAFTNVNNALP